MRKRLTFIFSGLFAALSGITIYNISSEGLKSIERDFTERTVLFAEYIKNSIVTLMLEGKGRDFQALLESERISDIKRIRLLRDDGFIIGSSERSEVGGFLPDEEFKEIRNISSPFKESDSEHPLRLVVIPLYNELPCQRCHDDGRRLRAFLAIEVSSTRYLSNISSIKMRSILYFVSLLIVSAFLIWLLTGSLVERPIREIIKTTITVRSDPKVRIPIKGRDELGILSKALNDIFSEFERTKRDFELCHLSEIRRIQEMTTLGELASAIAHEIRNPLAGISGAVQVLSEEFSESDPRQAIIKEILKEVERLDRSVKDLLLFARTPEPELKHVSVPFIIERLLRFIEPQAKRNNVTIKTEIPDELSELFVDPEQIHYAFYNIASVSLENMPGGGILTISARKTEKECTISFSDTGQGIPQDEIESLFKPFYIRHLEGRTAGSLGLTISRGIIERHGGRIDVEGLVARGTTFTVHLPCG